MNTLAPAANTHNTDQAWRPLHVFNLYRLIVVGAIAVIFFFTPPGATTFGNTLPAVFAATILTWLAIAFASGFASRMRRPGFRLQVYSLILADIGFINLLMYASGGITSGLGVLLLVTIAAGSIMLVNRMSFAFAALASLAILAIHGYSILRGHDVSATAYTQSGLLGAGLFAIALITNALAQRIRASEALAQQRGDELADLSRVNELIIQQMDTGILVVDRDSKIRLANEVARQILAADEEPVGQSLQKLSLQLKQNFDHWRESSLSDLKPFRAETGSSEILPRFARLGGRSGLATLIFLDDTAQLSHQAQQVKLASLGRLTASIAHEIRNPLSAINHAAQLLDESGELAREDHRLIEIIRQQSKRLDTIVENVLSLSRKQELKSEKIDLNSWMRNFRDTLLQDQHLAAEDIQLELPDTAVEVQMDASHLGQILCNLCENGLRHSSNASPRLRLQVSCHSSHKAKHGSKEVHLDIQDYGPGIKPEHREKLFEPFFTTEPTGTGLGLFLARELSELNHAHLNHIDESEGGAHFRLTFTRDDR